jgi:hypothetical protein
MGPTQVTCFFPSEEFRESYRRDRGKRKTLAEWGWNSASIGLRPSEIGPVVVAGEGEKRGLHWICFRLLADEIIPLL